MNRRFVLNVAVLACLLLALPALAKERGGVRMPDQITFAGQALQLNGMGIREATFLNIDVYVAGLYLQHRTSDASKIIASGEPKRLVMRFVREVERSDVVDAYREGFEKNVGKAAASELAPRIERLVGWMTGFREGETLEFGFLPGGGVEVTVKGQVKGKIPGADFSRAVMSLWLGPSPPNSGLKAGLLGKE